MTPDGLGSKHMRPQKHSTDCPPRADAPTILYRLYGADDALLYIGITGNKVQRFEGHRRNTRWWKQVARKELTTFPDRASAVAAEEKAVLAEQPRYNVEYTRPKPSKVLSVTLYPAQQARLEAFSAKHGLAMSAAMRKLIDDHA